MVGEPIAIPEVFGIYRALLQVDIAGPSVLKTVRYPCGSCAVVERDGSACESAHPTQSVSSLHRRLGPSVPGILVCKLAEVRLPYSWNEMAPVLIARKRTWLAPGLGRQGFVVKAKPYWAASTRCYHSLINWAWRGCKMCNIAGARRAVHSEVLVLGHWVVSQLCNCLATAEAVNGGFIELVRAYWEVVNC